MNTHIPWSDLELVLAIGRGGSLRAAAKSLGVSHPTVSRRLADLHASLGVSLFEKKGRRLRLTPAGEDLTATASRIEAEVDGLQRRIVGRDHRLEGNVRVSLSPTMFAALTPALPEFYTRYPRITLEFLTAITFASLTQREAEVAIRFTNSPQETLVGRRLGQFQQAVYIRQDRLAAFYAKGHDNPLRWPWIDWDEAHSHHSSACWVRDHVASEDVTLRCDNSLTMYQAVKAGVGVGFCPTMLAHPDPELVRVTTAHAMPTFERGLWVLTHADLRDTGRIRATTDWLGGVLRTEGGGVWQGRVGDLYRTG